MQKSLPAIKIAEEILRLTTMITDEQIIEAINAISKTEGTWGILWGLSNIATSGKDLDLYALKKETLNFVLEMRKDKHYPLVCVMVGLMERKRLANI